MGTEKPTKQNFWQQSKNTIIIVVIAILLYQALENLGSLVNGFHWLMRALMPLFLALGIVFLANMVLSVIEKRLLKRWQGKKGTRIFSTVVSLLFILAVIGVLVFLIGSKIIESITVLNINFDSYVASLAAWGDAMIEKLELSDSTANYIFSTMQKLLDQIDLLIDNLLGFAFRTTLSTLNVLFNFVLAFFFSFYLLYSKDSLIKQIKKLVLAIFKKKHSSRILSVSSKSYDILLRYFRGVIIDCTILGILCYIGMQIFHFPFALLISTFIAITQIIPFVGPWIGTAAGAILILLIDPSKVIWFIVMVIVIQQIEGNLIYPRIVGGVVGISGFWALFAVILGGKLFGVVGVLLGVPAMAVLYTFISVWTNQRIEAEADNIHKPPSDEDDEASQPTEDAENATEET